MTRTRLNMIFAGSNRDRAVSVQNPMNNLSANAVMQAAGIFVAANPFDEHTGNITALRSAEIITVNELVLI